MDIGTMAVVFVLAGLATFFLMTLTILFVLVAVSVLENLP